MLIIGAPWGQIQFVIYKLVYHWFDHATKCTGRTFITCITVPPKLWTRIANPKPHIPKVNAERIIQSNMLIFIISLTPHEQHGKQLLIQQLVLAKKKINYLCCGLLLLCVENTLTEGQFHWRRASNRKIVSISWFYIIFHTTYGVFNL